ncbi:MAG: GNAT family N-acetyltransferase [Blastococcus sp.]|nr:GNAT family N-acetyltransferase [Blastococcus sp.]
MPGRRHPALEAIGAVALYGGRRDPVRHRDHRAGAGRGSGLLTAVEADGEFVGSAGLHLTPGPLGPAIGYWTAPWARRRGYAAEAAQALAQWGLGLGAPRVHLMADVDNIASQAVALRAGFTREGTVRSCLDQRNGSWTDAALFSRLPED